MIVHSMRKYTYTFYLESLYKKRVANSLMPSDWLFDMDRCFRSISITFRKILSNYRYKFILIFIFSQGFDVNI